MSCSTVRGTMDEGRVFGFILTERSGRAVKIQTHFHKRCLT